MPSAVGSPTCTGAPWADDNGAVILVAWTACVRVIGHIEQGVNVPMYRTSVACRPAGRFAGPLVVSMRPMTPDQAVRATEITAPFTSAHGAPVHVGDPTALGITALDVPDYGDAVEVRDGEVPVFWACGVTPQAVAQASKPELMITHAPGHMFIPT